MSPIDHTEPEQYSRFLPPYLTSDNGDCTTDMPNTPLPSFRAPLLHPWPASFIGSQQLPVLLPSAPRRHPTHSARKFSISCKPYWTILKPSMPPHEAQLLSLTQDALHRPLSAKLLQLVIHSHHSFHLMIFCFPNTSHQCLSNSVHWQTNFMIAMSTYHLYYFCILFPLTSFFTKIKSFQIRLCINAVNGKLKSVATIKIKL